MNNHLPLASVLGVRETNHTINDGLVCDALKRYLNLSILLYESCIARPPFLILSTDGKKRVW